MNELLNKEIKKVQKQMKTFDVQSKEYQQCLKTLGTLQKMLDEEEAKERAKSRAAKDEERVARQSELEERRLEIEEDRLQYQRNIDKQRLDNDRKERRSKILLGIGTAVATMAPSIIAIILNHRTSQKVINMEYVDNLITPRTVKECSQNINKFIK